MSIKILKIGLLLIFILYCGRLIAQPINLTNLPANGPNTRFNQSDLFPNNTFRPFLSIRGFDSQTLPNGNNFGYGLKQVLEIHINSSNESVSSVVNALRDTASIAFTSLTGNLENKMNQINRNTRIIQAKAFVALSTLVLEQNGYAALSQDSLDGFGKPHSTAMAELKDALVIPPGGMLMAGDLVVSAAKNDTENAFAILLGMADGLDPVHATRSLNNIARALDLYLAIENAYAHYGLSDGALLTQSQRNGLFALFGRNIRALHRVNMLKVNDINTLLQPVNPSIINNIALFVSVKIWANIAGLFLDDPLHKLQPGNWPFKIFLSTGYASLAMNGTSLSQYAGYFTDAYVSAGKQENSGRTNYWSYQTDNGNRFWAEGPHYLHFTLEDIIPFWHAVRGAKFWKNSNHAGGILRTASLDVSDPFHSGWFTSPLKWLADIATPDGKYPPLDDGNKRAMSRSSILRWTSGYGNSTVGQKFAAINEQAGSFGSAANLLLVELAIPRNQSAGSMPAYDITNSDGQDQQLVLRRNSSSGMHYVLLNGERGRAITRGEGHEQPDQLQLLYYVGGTSYLMDSGYDKGGLSNNSTWNNYVYHNGMSHMNGWNVNPPYNGWQLSIIDPDFAIRKIMDNHPVHNLAHATGGNITELSGNMTIYDYVDTGYIFTDSISTLSQVKVFSLLNRSVLFIHDGGNPYLIDINRVIGYRHLYPDIVNEHNYFQDISNTYYIYKYRLKYHTNAVSNGIVTTDGKKWARFLFNDAEPLYIYSNFVEYDNQDVILGQQLVQEDQPATSQTIQLDHQGGRHLNSVSFIRTTPTSQTIPTPVYAYGSQNHQVWKWEQDSNTLDVLIKRGGNSTGTITFAVSHDNATTGQVTLAAGKDHGFARLVRENGMWIIHSDYKLNIEQPGYFYTSSQSVGNVTYPLGSSIYIGSNQTLTITGHAQFGHGTSVTLGTGAAIVVSGFGRITANGTTFTSTDPNDPSKAYGMIQLLTSGNSFTDCVFQGGGNLGNLLVQGSGTQILGGELRKGGRGMVAASGDVQVRGTSISANHGSGIYVTSGSVRLGSSWTYMIGTGPTTYRQYEPVTVTSNGGPGIEVVGVGQVVLDSARVSGNTSREIHLGTGGRVYAGHGSSGGGGGLEIVYADMGWNHIGGSGYYIYNTALSFDGETYLSWTVPARYNFWGGPTAPPAGKFWGPVNRSDHLGTDPTQNHYQVCIAGCQYKALPGAAVTSAAMASAIASRADTPREGLELVRARERILALRTQVDARPDHPSVIRLLMEWDDLVSFLGADKLREEDRSLGAWLTPRAAALSPATSTSVSGSRLVREASRVLEMRRQFRAGDMAALAEASADAVTRMGNPDNKLAVLLYRLEAMMALGRYEDAFRTLVRIESVRPEAGLAGLDHIPTDYSTYGHLLAEESGIRDWRTRFGGFVDEAQDPGAKTGLMPAWPNPFNPTTTIPFELAAEGRAYIAVYDLLGRQVAVLVDGVRASGAHQANLDARHLASGTYIVRAVLDGQVHTRKITLVK